MLELPPKVAQCRTLASALKVLGRTQESGVVQLRSNELNGVVSFSDGNITGAYIVGTGKGGEEAFLELIQAQFDTCESLVEDSQLFNARNRCEISISSVTPHDSSDPNATKEWDPEFLERIMRESIEITGEINMAGSRASDLPKGSASASEPVIVGSETGSLSKAQKIVLSESRHFTDVESFYDTVDPGLVQQESNTELKKELLDKVVLDHGPFESDELGLAIDEQQSLGDKQKDLLQVYAAVSDAASFEEHEVALSEEPVHSTEEAWVAEHQQRPAEVVQAEFVSQDPKLETLDNVDFAPFVEPPSDDGAVEAEPEAPLPEIAGTDYDGLIAPRPTGIIQKDALGLVTRPGDPNHVPAAYTGPRARPAVSIDPRFIGVAVLTVLSVGLFIVPSMIRDSAGGDKNLANQSMQSALREELHDEVPYNVSKPSDLPKGSSSGTGAGARGGGSNSISAEPGPLGLISESGVAKTGDVAIDQLEMQLLGEPNSVQLRAQLIRLLIARKAFERARVLAIIGFKDIPCSPDEKQLFWKLFKESK